MKKQPRLTVLMPVYNVEQYLEEAINSVLRQTYTDFTLLILDDCSTDKTGKIAQSISDNRITYYRQSVNVGLAENLNTGIELAKTEFISRMDGDDIMVESCLEKQITFLDSHPDIDICSVGFKFFGTKTSTVLFPEKHEEIKAGQLFGNCVILPVIRRGTFIKNNLRYKTSAFPAEDYRMWAECIRVAKIHNLQEILFYYRMHPEQISTEKHQRQVQKSDEVRLFMLEWLSEDFTEEEKSFFINIFVPAFPKSKKELKEIKRFASLLEDKNKIAQNFGTKELRFGLKKHIQNTTYYVVISLFFEKEFSLVNYCQYLFSGFLGTISFKSNIKTLLNSILHKKNNKIHF